MVIAPCKVWRDEWLGIELPPGNGTPWAIAVDGQTHHHTGATDTRFIPFDCPPLPGSAKGSRGDALSKSFSRWDDGRNNRFLAFDSAGLLEHQGLESHCTCGKVHRGTFPAGVSAPVQYGAHSKAAVVQLTHHHMLPLARTGELMGDLFGLPMSDATVLAIQAESASPTITPPMTRSSRLGKPPTRGPHPRVNAVGPSRARR
ncbi:hypothetical protein [uncultured Lamprocystis sp.]|jgi:hypothetical protein|uniref:hypothetical protein n=1 Tax=uncultured Lamprocystis sp. TaxID=543132 RepID=UPI0025CC9234|nr:hypothetical protein [uncultured Lamprocystis sp.]